MASPVLFPLDLGELSFEAAGNALVRRTVLPSGVRVLTENVPGARSVTLGFWVAVGSRDEVAAEGAQGTAGGHPASLGSTHFLEHLLFKGTPTRSAFDIASAFDAVGGEQNAVTAKEYTCYYAKVRDADTEMAVDVMADMLTSSVLDPAEFETERGVILEELAMAEDDPTDVAQERLFEAVLGEHPLGRPIGGDADTIRAASRDGVMTHYRANYRPNDLVVSAAGNIDHDRLVEWLSRNLAAAGWDMAATAAPVARRSTTPVSVVRAQPLVVVERPTEQANLMIGWPGITSTDDRRVALAAMNAILGGGMSSRLFQEIREKRGLAYSVYSFSSGYSDAGVFGLYAGCSPRNVAEVGSLLLDEFHRLATDGVTAAELARATGQLAGSAALALEDTDTRMSRLGRAEIGSGEFIDYEASMGMLNAVTIDQITALAADIAARDASVVVVGKATESEMNDIVEKGRAWGTHSS
jgi:predicted Zn-dependent peptidase